METLAYIALLAIIMGLAMTGYLRFEEQSRRLRGVATDIETAVSLGERWRADIRKANGTVEFLEGKGELCIPQKEGQVIYRFAGSTIERKDKGAFVAVLQNVQSSTMQNAGRTHVVSWRWELELKVRGKNPKLQPLFQFEAVAPQTL